MVQIGIYEGQDPSKVGTYTQWAGQPPDNVLNYINNDSWSGFASSVPWQVQRWQGAGVASIWSVPLTVWGTSLEQVATGAYDNYFQAAANALAQAVPSKDGNIYVRLGWEFNGTWMPWAAQGHEAAFIKTFQDVVDVFRSVSDKFKFVWDVNEGGSTIDPAKAYPGDHYVDVVGMDTYYNKAYNSADPAKAFQDKVVEPYGLQWQQDFAAEHGKPTAISEWGVQTDDSAPFVKAMADWMSSHHMVYGNYWDSNDAGFAGQLDSGQHPGAAAAYLSAFGAAPLTIDTDYRDPSATWAYPAGSVIHFSGDHLVESTITLAGDPTFAVESGHVVTLSGAVVDQASAAPGQVEKDGGGTLILGHINSYSGGTILLAGAVELAVAGSAGSGAITFTDGAQTLIVDRAALDADHRLANTIANFGAGDTIDLRSVGQNAAVAFDQATGTLSVTDAATGASLAILHLTGDYAGQTFQASSDGAGGTTINYAPTPSDTLVLRVSGDAWNGTPHFAVLVDGQQVGGTLTTNASHAAGQTEDLTLTGNFGPGAHAIAIRFLDDASGGTTATDRNLYVHEMILDGHAYSGDAAVNTAGWNNNGVAGIYSNGDATFHTTATDILWHV
ncbi:hypothetical protein MKK55_06215 [Methylobacterium sp. J-059]|uniref:carbohydrate-binding domain-containing protein n=2 Tax=unclassified Methylobacterium TaxID=2615210 RepID=UPI001FBAFD7A|nr:carbohydrate-binding domain-containing protein [Methylobacterium sp. J-059]MCJ2038551.1 hypothetical protein [Methylobacterium sp. J-059]